MTPQIPSNTLESKQGQSPRSEQYCKLNILRAGKLRFIFNIKSLEVCRMHGMPLNCSVYMEAVHIPCCSKEKERYPMLIDRRNTKDMLGTSITQQLRIQGDQAYGPFILS
jgi:hypothetical protein